MEAVRIYSPHMIMATIEQFRQDPRTLFALCPAKYQYGTITIITLLAAAHWEHPTGFLPDLNEIIGALVAIMCMGLLICVAVTVEEYFETATWPWQHDGPMKKWRAWVWGVLDDESGMSSDGGDADTASASLQANEIEIEIAENMHPSFMDLDRETHTVADQRFPSPITPLLLHGLRPAADDLPAPTHKSGLLGESPVPRKFKHFSGDGFRRRSEALNAVARYSGSDKSYMAVKSALSVLKEEANEDN